MNPTGTDLDRIGLAGLFFLCGTCVATHLWDTSATATAPAPAPISRPVARHSVAKRFVISARFAMDPKDTRYVESGFVERRAVPDDQPIPLRALRSLDQVHGQLLAIPVAVGEVLEVKHFRPPTAAERYEMVQSRRTGPAWVVDTSGEYDPPDGSAEQAPPLNHPTFSPGVAVRR